MNKKKIIILSVVFLSIVFLILDFLSYRVDKIVKNLIIDQGNQALGQQVSVGKIDTSILGSSIKISNIEIKNLEKIVLYDISGNDDLHQLETVSSRHPTSSHQCDPE